MIKKLTLDCLTWLKTLELTLEEYTGDEINFAYDDYELRMSRQQFFELGILFVTISKVEDFKSDCFWYTVVDQEFNADCQIGIAHIGAVVDVHIGEKYFRISKKQALDLGNAMVLLAGGDVKTQWADELLSNYGLV